MILNADDFGLNDEVNRAIGEAFRLDLCSSATLMANGDAFESACEIVREMSLHQHIGVHLTLTAGAPVGKKIKACPKFCDENGRLGVKRNWRLHVLSSSESEAVREEFCAQIRRCRGYGIQPTHADTHHHVGEFLGIGRALLTAVKLEQVPYVRLARNVGRGRGVLKKAYRHLVNRRISSKKLARTRWFGSIADYLAVKTWREDPDSRFDCEVMLHPSFSETGVLIDAFTSQPLDLLIRELRQSCMGPFRSFSGRSYDAR